MCGRSPTRLPCLTTSRVSRSTPPTATTSWRARTTPARAATAKDLTDAQAALTAAQATFDKAKSGGYTASDITSARLQLDAAQAKLVQLKAGPTQADIDSAKAAIATAQDKLAEAQHGNAIAADLANAHAALTSAKIKLSQAINGNATAATLVTPEYSFPAPMSAGSHSTFAFGTAVTTEYAPMHNTQVAEGSFITQEQVDAARNVVVLGSRVANRLFNGQDALGKQIRIHGISFRVVGVLAAKGGNSFGSADDSAYIPLNTALRQLGHEKVSNQGGSDAVSAITVQAKDQNSINQAISQIDATMRARHRVSTDGSADDFTIDNQQDLINTETASTRTLTLCFSRPSRRFRWWWAASAS